jgi:hypothetical protein
LKERKLSLSSAYEYLHGDTKGRDSDIDEFRDKPFYCWDTSYLGRGNCCFNHLVGLPVDAKTYERRPLFPYQLKVYEAWEHFKHIWIKKATGLGISEFFIRLMLWLCVRDDEYIGAKMCIVTGPNLDIAKTLMRRMRDIVKDYKAFDFDEEKADKLVINGCSIQAYPANHIDSYRGLAKVKFIFLDEADFFRKGGEEYGKEVRKVSERYIAKSKPYIVMVSTPNRPDGLFAQIEQEPEDQCLYYRMQLDYTEGLGYIYSQEDINEAKKSDSFEQEYNLKYGGKEGNTFTTEQVNLAIEKGLELRDSNPDLKPKATRLHLWGLDPGGGSSKTALVIAELNKDSNTIDILHSQEYGRDWSPSRIADDIFNLFLECGEIRENNKIYIDGARPDFINEVKIRFGERTDWEKVEDVNEREDSIIPVNFRVEHKYMLSNLHSMLANGMIRLPKSKDDTESFDKIVTALKTAWSKEWNLDKNETVNDDHLDALRLACKGISIEEEN